MDSISKRHIDVVFFERIVILSVKNEAPLERRLCL